MNISICLRYELKETEGIGSKARAEDLVLARVSDRRRFMVWMMNVDFLSACLLEKKTISYDMKLSKLEFNMLQGNLSQTN